MDNRERTAIANRLYEEYGKPLEQEHRGEFVAISVTGKIVLGNTLLEVTERARAILGAGSYTFKVGPRAVGKLL